jgi:hypothetical protein
MWYGTAAAQNSMDVVWKLKIDLPYHSAISLLETCIKELKAESQTDVVTPSSWSFIHNEQMAETS